MDVTDQILSIVRTYGSSNNTNPAYAASNRTLDYHEGGSITRPEVDRVGIIPYQIHYEDTVGLFGKENHFVKIDLKIDKDKAFKCFEEEGWQCAIVTEKIDDDKYYEEVKFTQGEPVLVNSYYTAEIGTNNPLPSLVGAYVSVKLDNLKTGNKYIDEWLDMRLYTKAREEHPYNQMYCGLNDWFYIGFHARNTRRLPYNIQCTIGDEYLSYNSMSDEQRRLIAKTN